MSHPQSFEFAKLRGFNWYNSSTDDEQKLGLFCILRSLGSQCHHLQCCHCMLSLGMGFAATEGFGRCTDPGWPGAAWIVGTSWVCWMSGMLMVHEAFLGLWCFDNWHRSVWKLQSSTVVCLRHFKHPGSVLPPRLYNTTLRACEESHQQAATVALCSSLDEKSLRADEVTYSTAIACVEWQQAFLFLQDMHRTLGFYSRGGMLVVGLLFCHSSPQNGGSCFWVWAKQGTSLAPEGLPRWQFGQRNKHRICVYKVQGWIFQTLWFWEMNDENKYSGYIAKYTISTYSFNADSSNSLLKLMFQEEAGRQRRCIQRRHHILWEVQSLGRGLAVASNDAGSPSGSKQIMSSMRETVTHPMIHVGFVYFLHEFASTSYIFLTTLMEYFEIFDQFLSLLFFRGAATWWGCHHLQCSGQRLCKRRARYFGAASLFAVSGVAGGGKEVIQCLLSRLEVRGCKDEIVKVHEGQRCLICMKSMKLFLVHMSHGQNKRRPI